MTRGGRSPGVGRRGLTHRTDPVRTSVRSPETTGPGDAGQGTLFATDSVFNVNSFDWDHQDQGDYRDCSDRSSAISAATTEVAASTDNQPRSNPLNPGNP